MREILVGRNQEISDLREWVNSERSEFIAVYGRRRVGKTFLVKKAVGKELLFHFSGSALQARKEQLQNFGFALRDQTKDKEVRIPSSWSEAFHDLSRIIEKSTRKKKIIFLDELPWIDTPKSGFIGALEYFWNNFCAWRDDVKLIVCGSATSWIINKLIRGRGGLHNRVTHLMRVAPFDLGQCEEYFKVYGFKFQRRQIAECYMVMGGIPYYFSLMSKELSLAANIDFLFFQSDAPLKNEFDDLYRALFKNYENYVEVIKVLAKKGIGLTRQELLSATGLANNGEFSKILEELELCGFLRSYLPFETVNDNRKKLTKAARATIYQLVDFYTLFYLRFNHQGALKNDNYWSSQLHSPQIIVWRGITFEMLCLHHVKQIKRALGIGDVSTNECSWIGKNDDKKVQIDLLIDRNDDTINLCEMKYSVKEFKIDREYYEKLESKVEVFMEETHTHKNILLTLISAQGLTPNQYSDIIQRLVTLDDLF